MDNFTLNRLDLSREGLKNKVISYSPFHKTLPKFSLHKPWNSVGFYEMGDS